MLKIALIVILGVFPLCSLSSSFDGDSQTFEFEKFRCPADLTRVGLLVDPDFCDRYLICKPDGQKVTRLCASGFAFDLSTYTCQPSEDVECGVRGQFKRGQLINPKCPTPNGLFPTKENCEKFTLCREYQSIDMVRINSLFTCSVSSNSCSRSC